MRPTAARGTRDVREALLGDTQLLELDDHLQRRLYLTAEAVARQVQTRWGVRYTPSGMTAVLHRLGFPGRRRLSRSVCSRSSTGAGAVCRWPSPSIFAA
ncbi:winged helix-turn-helix domain-containing protein [uncultured Thiodictyon sp.]|uniref:winged helix-turn-helix domain-containing protein n=1 Tax=uncultured Thiodictyon sp. TaxID=1846217 RepID=UPI0034322C59